MLPIVCRAEEADLRLAAALTLRYTKAPPGEPRPVAVAPVVGAATGTCRSEGGSAPPAPSAEPADGPSRFIRVAPAEEAEVRRWLVAPENP